MRLQTSLAPAGEVASVSFADIVEAPTTPVVCHVAARDEVAARDYLAIIGRPDAVIHVHRDSLDWSGIAANEHHGEVPLFILPATAPVLRQQFFGGLALRFFVDHLYRPEDDHSSNRLFVVGTTRWAWTMTGAGSAQPSERVAQRRKKRLEERFGPLYLHAQDVERALKAPGVHKIKLHALGPEGTNIARACRHFVAALGIESRAEVVVHPNKVEPLEYAEIAARERREGVVPLHAECAVYYELDRLFETRRSELVFAAHLYLPLDGMQLAARQGSCVTTGTIASHPSPRGLARRWFQAGAEFVAASSNADAAMMVAAGEAEMCITTASASRALGLQTLEDYGSPTMLFTFGTPLGGRDIRRILAH